MSMASYFGSMPGMIDDIDNLATIMANRAVISLGREGVNPEDIHLSLEKAKLSNQDFAEIFASVKKIYQNMPEKLADISHLWNGNRGKRPDFALEIADAMASSYGLNVRKIRHYTEEESKNANASNIQFIGEDLVLPRNTDAYDLAPLSLHNDIFNVLFEKHGDQIVSDIIGKRDYSGFGENAEKAEKAIKDSFNSYLKELLPELFARSIREAYKTGYKTYDGKSSDSENYDFLFDRVQKAISNKKIDFNDIDSLYFAGSAFNPGLPEDKTSLALLEKISLDTTVPSEDRAQAVYRLTKYACSFNHDSFAIPAQKFLDNNPEILKGLSFKEKEFGLIEEPAGSGDFVRDKKLLKIRQILSFNPPYISCVAIWDAANQFRAKGKENSLDRLIPFTQEASLKFESWADSDKKNLADLNTFINASLKDLDAWKNLNSRIEEKLSKTSIPADQPVAVAIQNYMREVKLKQENRNDTITLINLDNLSDRLIWALEGEEYIQGSYYNRVKEAELLKTLTRIEELQKNPADNKIIQIDRDELPPPEFLKDSQRTSKEEAEDVAKTLKDIAAYVNGTPLEKLPHLKKGDFGFDSEKPGDINRSAYTYIAPTDIKTVKNNGYTHVECSIGGYEFGFSKYSVAEIQRGEKLPPFGAFMTAMLLQKEQGNTKVIVHTKEPGFLYMAAMAAAMHGLTVQAADNEKVILSAEQQKEVNNVLEEYRRKNSDYMADFKKNSPDYAYLNKRRKNIDTLTSQTKEIYNNRFNVIYDKAEISLYGKKREDFLDALTKEQKTFTDTLESLTDNLPDIYRFTLLKDTIRQAGGGEKDFTDMLERAKNATLTGEDKALFEKISLKPEDLTEDAYNRYTESLEKLSTVLKNSPLSEEESRRLLKEFSHQTIEPEALEKVTEYILAANGTSLKTEKDVTKIKMAVPKPSSAKYAEYVNSQEKHLAEAFAKPEMSAYAGTMAEVQNYIAAASDEEKPAAYVNAIKTAQRMRKGNLNDGQTSILFARDCFGSRIVDLNGARVNPAALQAYMYESCVFLNNVAEKTEEFPDGEEKDRLKSLIASSGAEYEAGLKAFTDAYDADAKGLVKTLKEKGISEDILKEINSGKISAFNLDSCVRALAKDKLFSLTRFSEEHGSVKKSAIVSIYKITKAETERLKSEDMPEEAKQAILITYQAVANDMDADKSLYKIPVSDLPAYMDTKVGEKLVKLLGEDFRGKKLTQDEFKAMKATANITENGIGEHIREEFAQRFVANRHSR